MSRRRISCKDLGHADCQGWLYKKKEKGTFLSNKWKKFWVVLKGSSLYWYSNQMAEKADGFVNLPDFTVERASECKKKHAFKINHPQIKAFYFAAENLQEMNVWLNKLGFAVIHQESTTKDEECYSESEQEDPETASETPPPPCASATSSPVVRVDCKEHDLAMINQLLDDPKLTARKYREWKVMNTLLIQDIYHQQQVPQDPEVASQELKNPSSSDCVENSL
ncbi:Interactor protein for cytohesin exchange factors 1 [Cricetulus griseus]|uniref:Interactor protein for cytohesin exchange factors 1 n=1 Tax=Cricetulus griseus TaxID=10029 RepID=G3GU32_CRIGR|nr:Interactor protein for cytohesin exchange factors 1 [Cricetulus griseus]ERE84228.1 interactor protein for cytohesin exchange factors 1 [Cricetulus griseus]